MAISIPAVKDGEWAAFFLIQLFVYILHLLSFVCEWNFLYQISNSLFIFLFLRKNVNKYYTVYLQQKTLPCSYDSENKQIGNCKLI